MDLAALKARFAAQMPGLAEFTELAKEYEQLLAAYVALEQKWNQASPSRVLELEETIAALQLAKKADGPITEGVKK